MQVFLLLQAPQVPTAIVILTVNAFREKQDPQRSHQCGSGGCNKTFSVHLTLLCLPLNQGESDSGTMSTYSRTSSLMGTPLLLVNLTTADVK